MTVHLVNRDGEKITVKGSPGDTLLDIIIDQDIDIDGFGECGWIHIAFKVFFFPPYWLDIHTSRWAIPVSRSQNELMLPSPPFSSHLSSPPISSPLLSPLSSPLISFPPLPGACEGTLACSTCHLVFDEDVYKQLGPVTDEEMDMLDLAYGLTDT